MNTTQDPKEERQEQSDLIVDDAGLARPRWAEHSPLLREYYDHEWGMPVYGESELFERLVLEGFQAGLAWSTVLHKREAFRTAFAGFDADTVAAFGETDVDRLLGNEAIIRNEQKIRSAIRNARATVALREEGGLSALIWSFQPQENYYPERLSDIPSKSPESQAMARALKAAGFSFVGPVTCFALMEAIGMVDTHLVGSHRRGSSGIWRN